MTNLIYVGVENEYQYVHDGELQNISTDLERMLKRSSKGFFYKSPTSVRTECGSALYSDAGDPEVCSSPVRVEKGFASRATDAVYLASKELIDLLSQDPKSDLIGYTSHWNLTNVLKSTMRVEAMKDFAIPYGLFTLSPISVGINLRYKNDPSPGRLELLGDYIENLDQVKAFFLFYAGTMLNYEENATKLPFTLDVQNLHANARFNNPVRDGRHTVVDAAKPAFGPANSGLTAQDCLEATYELFHEGIKALGTKEEIQLLESFIYGDRKLEIDRFKRYAFTHLQKTNTLRVLPHRALMLDIYDYTEQRDLPDNLSKMLGMFATQKSYQTAINNSNQTLNTSNLTWESFTFDQNNFFYILGSFEKMVFASEVLSSVSDKREKELVLRDICQSLLDNETDIASFNQLITDENPELMSRQFNRLVAANKPALQSAIGQVLNNSTPCNITSSVADSDKLLSEIMDREHKPYIKEEDQSFFDLDSLVEKRKPIKRKISLRKIWQDSGMNLEDEEDYFYIPIISLLAGAAIGYVVSNIFDQEPNLGPKIETGIEEIIVGDQNE